jgi:hypothetical protein
VAGRAELTDLVGSAGLTPLDAEPYSGFEHWVDQAIVRDILVAKKP